jgi:hypothetical protein
MRYIVTTDGTMMAHVVILSTYPIMARRNGSEYALTGQKRTEGQCFLYGPEFQLVVGPDDCKIEDLQPDSIPPWTLIFPEVERQILAKWIPEARVTVLSWRPAKPGEIPTDRSFRAAWRDAWPLRVDMDEARRIHRDRIRAARAPKLQELDIQYMRASETGAAVDEILSRKRALRDATIDPRIDAAETPEELKSIWPLEDK